MGWGQTNAIQAGVGMATANARLQEQRSQFEKSFAQNQKQFDDSMAWQKESFNRNTALQKKQQRYQKKQDAKAENVAKMNMGVQIGSLALNAYQNDDIMGPSNIDSGKGASVSPVGENATGDLEVSSINETSTQAGGIQSPSRTGRIEGDSWTRGFTDNWSSWAMGGAAGGMMGSTAAQMAFGEGKTQSTAGGAFGGAVGGYYASGGTWQGAVGGAVVGGILGYLF